MPKFVSNPVSGGTGEKKRFEGVREVVIVNAGYFRKGTTWKDKILVDDMLADESNPEHMQFFQFKLASGVSEVLNAIYKYGRANAKFSDWGKAYKLFGLSPSASLQDTVGKKCKVLFYAGTTGYSEVWDRMYATNVPDGQIEADFEATLERSEYMRKKVSPESRYALDKAPVTAEENLPF